MKITELKIIKFRSIKDSKITLHDITAIVGENNSGKTAILRAINSVLNYKQEEEWFINKAHQFAPKTNSSITITFSDIPNRQYYDNYRTGNSLIIQMRFTYSSNKRSLTCIKGRDTLAIEDEFLAELSKDIEYVYIPASRSNKDTTWNSDSIFRNLLVNYSSQYTQNRDLLTTSIKSAALKIQRSVLSKLEKELSGLYMQNKSIDFRLEFNEALDYSFLLDQLSLSIEENGFKYPIRECGSGIKSLAIIAMYRANALLKHTHTVFGLEEPENNLHPQAQKRFILSLKQNMNITEIQTFFTTHSPVLVDELGHEDIILVRRTNDPRGICSSTSQLPNDFWNRYGVEEFRHYQFFNYKNSDFFFSKYIVLTESKNDSQVISKLITPQLKHNIADISILNVDGETNMKYPYFLLKELKIPFSMVVDKDFFVPYRNNILNESRNANTGLPIYANVLKSDNAIINDLFQLGSEKTVLKQKVNGNYRDFYNHLQQFHIFPMHYCLEMDLSCSSKARDEYYRMLNVVPANKTQKFLLTQNSKTIKDINKILSILGAIPPKSFPESFQKIRSGILNEIITLLNIKV